MRATLLLFMLAPLVVRTSGFGAKAALDHRVPFAVRTPSLGVKALDRGAPPLFQKRPPNAHAPPRVHRSTVVCSLGVAKLLRGGAAAPISLNMLTPSLHLCTRDLLSLLFGLVGATAWLKLCKMTVKLGYLEPKASRTHLWLHDADVRRRLNRRCSNSPSPIAPGIEKGRALR